MLKNRINAGSVRRESFDLRRIQISKQFGQFFMVKSSPKTHWEIDRIVKWHPQSGWHSSLTQSFCCAYLIRRQVIVFKNFFGN